MKTQLLFLSTLLFSFSISAQIDFEAHIIVDSHPDVSGPYKLIAADIDGDNDQDLFATSTNGDKVVWFKNTDGLGNFSEPIIINSTMDYPMDLAIADIDNDGDLDLVAISNYDHKIAWFENTDGLGSFGPLRLAGSFTYVQTVDAKDIDGDGDIDIIAGGNYKISWLENVDGIGTFAPEKIISEIAYTESIEVSDIDGDGDMDVTVADLPRNIVAWYENIDGLGTFGPEKLISDEVYASNTVATKDMDNDGDVDVISVSDGNYIGWYENTDGLGNFGSPRIISETSDFVYKLDVEDFDADGDNDVLASKYSNGEVILLLNDGDGNFGTAQVIYSDEYNPIGVLAADFNGDSKMDAAVGIYVSNQIIWFENKGPLGIEENNTNLFSLYPNPTNGLLNIQSKTSIDEITIFNNLGQLLLASENKNQIDISTLSEGIYFVKIKDENGQTETKKVLKK